MIYRIAMSIVGGTLVAALVAFILLGAFAVVLVAAHLLGLT